MHTEYKLTATEISEAMTAFVMKREGIQVSARVEIKLDSKGGTLIVHDAPVVILRPIK